MSKTTLDELRELAERILWEHSHGDGNPLRNVTARKELARTLAKALKAKMEERCQK